MLLYFNEMNVSADLSRLVKIRNIGINSVRLWTFILAITWWCLHYLSSVHVFRYLICYVPKFQTSLC